MTFALLVLSEWAIRVAMVPIVLHRRSHGAALAWLILIFMVPWVGVVAYFVLGTRGFGWRRVRRHERLRAGFAKLERIAETRAKLRASVVEGEVSAFAQVAERLAGVPRLAGNAAELIPDVPSSVKRLIEDIDSATQRVHLLFYIYADDDVGRAVGEALKRAAGRGVACRVIVDAVGSRGMFKRLGGELGAAGVKVEAFQPVNPLRRRFVRIDLRNHRKLAVIDGMVAYVGSMNICSARLGPPPGREQVDILVRLLGPVVAQLELVFLEDWCMQTGEAPPDVVVATESRGSTPIQVIATGPTAPVTVFRYVLVAAINQAKERLAITTPYLGLDDPLRLAVRLAALRGVKIDLMIPETGDQSIADAANRWWFKDLLDVGVRIHLHRPGFLHTKLLTVDDSFVLIGSSNLDQRSLALNFELNLALFGPEFVGAVQRVQEEYMANSRLVSAEEWAKRPYSQRMTHGAAHLMSPLL